VVKTREERYRDWYVRMDVPVEETTRIEKLQKFMEEKGFLSARTVEGRERQYRSMWEFIQAEFDIFGAAGIKPREIRYRWGKETRFALPYRRGWFGIKEAQRYARTVVDIPGLSVKYGREYIRRFLGL